MKTEDNNYNNDSKICNHCGTTTSSEAKYCPNCGKFLKTNLKPLYKKKCFLIPLALFLLIILINNIPENEATTLIYFVFAFVFLKIFKTISLAIYKLKNHEIDFSLSTKNNSENFDKQLLKTNTYNIHGNYANTVSLKKFLITLAIILFYIFMAFNVSSINSSIQNQYSNSILSKEMMLTNQQEKAILEIFDSCGIGEITDVKKFQGDETETSYHINDNETKYYGGVNYTIVVWLNNADKTIKSIYFNDRDIYINGNVVSKVTNHYISSELRSEYRTLAELYIKQFLKYPKTAKFGSSSQWAFSVNKNGYDVIQSSVDAKNAFGVESTLPFQILIDRSKQLPISLILDNKEYIKQKY